ncbi:MAG: hypothetical protein KY464_11150 [Gemmatimonadetes bacterium]|nr:hypothetical protein [Gemmatimonadota bacterium]
MEENRLGPDNPDALYKRGDVGTSPEVPPDDLFEDDEFGNERQRRDSSAIRAEDTEPYIALQYVARLFKIAAMVVVVALTAEVIAGVALEGAGAIFPLFAEVIRGIVLAAILWGAGDLTILLIDVGHDVRAARVLLGRLSARAAAQANDREEPL